MCMAKILLVDDAKVLLEVQKEFLRPSPVRVLTANNGAEALALARHERPDLVMMDVEMPVMDGMTCCAAIKGDAVLGSTPVILLSSNGGHEVVESSRRAGSDQFLQKPLSGREFLNMAHSFLPSIERRRPRVPCRIPVIVQAGGATLEAIGRDIGMNGINLATEREVGEGSEVVISFRLSANTHAITVAQGQVAWVIPPDRRTSGLSAGFGVEFREIRGEGVSQLRQCELADFISGLSRFGERGTGGGLEE